MIAQNMLRMLVVEDNPADVLMLRETFGDDPFIEFEIEQTNRLASAVGLLQEQEFDVVLLDLGLPDSQGVDTFVQLHSHAPNIPILVLTALDDDSVGLQTIQCGADDFIVKRKLQTDLLRNSAQYAAIRAKVRQEREEELKQKTRDLEQVLYVTSHDLRSPLINIQGYSRELEHQIGKLEWHAGRKTEEDRKVFREVLKEEIPHSLDYILSGVHKMDALLSGLLELSRIGKLKLNLEAITGKELFDYVIESMNFTIQKHDIELIVDELPACMGDLVQLNRVFTNLIENAIKYRHPQRRGRIRISGYTQGGLAVYCVEDNGIGVAEESQERIFKLFHRLKPKETEGDGLGLSIVQRIVERHKGEVEFQSEPDVGTTVMVKLLSADLFLEG